MHLFTTVARAALPHLKAPDPNALVIGPGRQQHIVYADAEIRDLGSVALAGAQQQSCIR